MVHVFNFLFANMNIAWNDFFEELCHFALHASLDKYVIFTFAALTFWKKLNMQVFNLFFIVFQFSSNIFIAACAFF